MADNPRRLVGETMYLGDPVDGGTPAAVGLERPRDKGQLSVAESPRRLYGPSYHVSHCSKRRRIR